MRRSSLILGSLLAAIGACAAAAPAEAQRLPQFARATVESPQVLARGGAGVAMPRAETALFYNPAQLARLHLQRPRIEILSSQGGVSTNFFGNVRFFMTDVLEAAKEGFSLPLSARERELFDEALERGRLATVGQAAASLPNITFSAGAASFAAGAFATNTTRFRFEDIGGGVPLLDFFSQADFIGAAGAATAIPSSPLAAGATVRVARRYLTSKLKDLLSMDPGREQLYVFSGTTVAVDLGLHALDVAPVLPGRLDFGVAAYDVVGGGFAYALDRTIALTGEGAVDQREVDRILASLEGRDGAMTFRAGAAYQMLNLLGPTTNLTLAVDWFSGSTSESAQPPLAGVRMGAELDLGGALTLNAGIGQGYPSGGIALNLPVARVDYAFFGVEDGRVPGQLQRYSHLLRVRFGIF